MLLPLQTYREKKSLIVLAAAAQESIDHNQNTVHIYPIESEMKDNKTCFRNMLLQNVCKQSFRFKNNDNKKKEISHGTK